MHKRSTLNSEQAWSPKVSDQNEWMYIDVGEEVDVSGIVMQGRSNQPHYNSGNDHSN
jgi:hypothetical protein